MAEPGHGDGIKSKIGNTSVNFYCSLDIDKVCWLIVVLLLMSLPILILIVG